MILSLAFLIVVIASLSRAILIVLADIYGNAIINVNAVFPFVQHLNTKKRGCN